MPRLATELRSPQVPQCWLEEGLKKAQSHRNTLYNQLRLIHIDRDCQPNIEASIGVAPEGKSDASQVGIQHMPEPLTTRKCVRRWWKNFTRDVGDKISVNIAKMWQRCQEKHNPMANATRTSGNTRQTRLQKPGAHEKSQLGHKKLCKKTTQAVLSRCEMR